jgi:hypothetical protein
MSNEDHFEFKETDFKYNERFLRNLNIKIYLMNRG